MSRIGILPIDIPEGVKINISKENIVKIGGIKVLFANKWNGEPKS